MFRNADHIEFVFLLCMVPAEALYSYRMLTPKCSYWKYLLIWLGYFFVFYTVTMQLERLFPNISIYLAPVLVADMVVHVGLFKRVSTRSIWWCILVYAGSVAILALGATIGQLIDNLISSIVSNPAELLWGHSYIIFTDLMQVFLLVIVSDFASRRIGSVSVDVRWSLFAILLVTQIYAEISITFLTTWNNRVLPNILMLGIFVAMCVTADLYMFRTFRSMVQNAQLEQNVALLNQQQALEKQHYMAASEQMLHMRQLRHDYANTLNTIASLLEMGELDKIRSILNSTSAQIAATHILYTGSPIIDAVFYSKQLDAAEKGVKLTCSLLWPTALRVQDTDLMRIFSNLLDNAIAYCQALPDSMERYVELTSALQGRKFAISFSNPYLSDTPPQIPAPGQTDAASAHGHGLAIVRQIMDTYNGCIDADCADGMLTFRVLFFL